MTTHSPGLAADLPTDGIRFIQKVGDGDTPTISSGVDVFGDVASVLGLVPDNRVKGLICVEGYTDVEAMKALSKVMNARNGAFPDLENDPRFAFVILGGGNLKHWVNNHYLKPLGLPEAHIYDADVPAYQASVDDVNARGDGSWAALTQKHEIECYLHPDAIHDAFGYTCAVEDVPTDQYPGVPKAFAVQWQAQGGFDATPGDTKSKARLMNAFRYMTYERLQGRDAAEEVESWMSRFLAMVE